jgi:hypothetical protein
MKTGRLVLAVSVAVLAVASTLLLVTSLASAEANHENARGSVAPRIVLDDSAEPALPPIKPPVTFPGGDWPWYAQEEILVHTEPPITGHATEICAEVVNQDPAQPHTVSRCSA